MSWVPLAFIAVGTAVKAVSDVQAGNAAAAAEEANAQIANLQATQVRQAGAFEESKIAREKAKTLSQQRARYAKSGVLITEGSPLEVMADTAAQYETDILVNRYNIAIEAGRFDYEARIRRDAAKRHVRIGTTRAVGGVLLTAGLVGSRYSGAPTKGFTPEGGSPASLDTSGWR